MKLYHGTNCRDIKEFKIISREKCIPEYGNGVYFTSNFEQAELWSCSRSNLGAVYEINIDLRKLKGKNLENDDLFYYLSYLNRIDLNELVKECLDELNAFDYIYGKMLKNISEFIENAEKFNSGDIDLMEFKKLTKWFGNGMDQYCFRNDKSRKLINDSIVKIYFTEKVGKKVKKVEEYIIK